MLRVVLIGLTIALLVTNAIWFVTALDTSVTVEHQETEVVRRSKQVELLAQLVRDYPRNVDAVTAYRIVQERFPDEVAKLRGDTVELGELRFEHRDRVLVRVMPF